MPIIRQPNPVPVRVKKQHLLLLAEHLEKLADTPGALPEPLPMLYLHIAAALTRGCRSQMTEAQFLCALEQAEALYTNIFESKAIPLSTLIFNLLRPECEPEDQSEAFIEDVFKHNVDPTRDDLEDMVDDDDESNFQP